MRRIICLILCVLCLCPMTAKAAEEKYVALTFDDGPRPGTTDVLLDGARHFALSQKAQRAVLQRIRGYRITGCRRQSDCHRQPGKDQAGYEAGQRQKEDNDNGTE